MPIEHDKAFAVSGRVIRYAAFGSAGRSKEAAYYAQYGGEADRAA
jgi:hypothetical protein